MKEHFLEAIKTDEPTVMEQKVKMLLKWKESTEDPTFHKLIDCFNEIRNVELVKVVKEIAETYGLVIEGNMSSCVI